MCFKYTKQILGYNLSTPIFAKTLKTMETAKSTGKFWVYFFISIVVLVIMSWFTPKFFWVVLPFNFTFFAKGMNLL